jgi:uroporphyrinogen-III synthase
MKRILVTRPQAQAESFVDGLRLAGFEPIYFPLIEIHPIENNTELDQALENLATYDWVIFTSVNGVEVVFDAIAIKALSLKKQFDNTLKVAAIGAKTAQALNMRGVAVDFAPADYVADAILPGLGNMHGKRFLLPRAEIARKELPEAILKAGGIVNDIAVYKTLPTRPGREGLNALKAGVDVITFTSASTVQNFIAVAKQNGLDPLSLPNNPLFACIGPITEQAAREEGLMNLVTAKEYTSEGLIQILSNLEKR